MMSPKSSLLAALNCVMTGALITSCTPSDEYDTPPPRRPNYGGYDAGAYGSESLYDSPPAYGDGALPRSEPLANPGGPAPGLPEDPGAAGTVPVAPSIPSPTPSPTRAATVHTVVRGDTLSGISRQYGVSMDAVRRANGMTGDIVVLGKKLIIPSR